MPPVGNDDASGSPWISSLPENSAIAVPSPVGAVERVVLLGGRAGQRLEPVRVVRGALLQRPLLHRLRDGVGQRGVERLAALERPLQRLVDVLGQPAGAARSARRRSRRRPGCRRGQVRRAQRGSVGAPLRGGDVLLASPGGMGGIDSSWKGSGERCVRAERNRSAKLLRWHHRLAKSQGRRFDRGPKGRVPPVGVRLAADKPPRRVQAAWSTRATGWPGRTPA